MRLGLARFGSVSLLVVGVFGLPVQAGSRFESSSASVPDPGGKTRVETLLGKLPLYFIENRGQEDPRVAYYVPGRDATVYLKPDGVTFALTSPRPRQAPRAAVYPASLRQEP